MTSADGSLCFGDLCIGSAGTTVTLAGQPVQLTFREHELLRFLAEHSDTWLTREQLLRHVWGEEYQGGGRTVDVHVVRLKARIEDEQHTYIDRPRDGGFRFHPEERRDGANDDR